MLFITIISQTLFLNVRQTTTVFFSHHQNTKQKYRERKKCVIPKTTTNLFFSFFFLREIKTQVRVLIKFVLYKKYRVVKEIS